MGSRFTDFNIYQPHDDDYGVTHFGAAGFNIRVSTPEGLEGLNNELTTYGFVYNFANFYGEEWHMFEKQFEKTGIWPDFTINFDNVGVGNDTRNMLRSILEHDSEINKITNLLRNEQAKQKFNHDLNCIRHNFNFILDGEFRNLPWREVW